MSASSSSADRNTGKAPVSGNAANETCSIVLSQQMLASTSNSHPITGPRYTNSYSGYKNQINMGYRFQRQQMFSSFFSHGRIVQNSYSGNINQRNMGAVQSKRQQMVSSFISRGCKVQYEDASRNLDTMSGVKYIAFTQYSKVMSMKRNGNSNVKDAWYGGTKDELKTILSNGFTFLPVTGTYGCGIYLSQQSVVPTNVPCDENGFKHFLFCRVILGNMEAIVPGSTQHKPSSDLYDSGVDNVESAKMYIIWNANINTHILPEFIISVKAPTQTQYKGIPRMPKSEYMSYTQLIKDLSKFLPDDAVELISKHHSEFAKRKISGNEMLERVKHVAGNELFTRIMKTNQDKQKPIEPKESIFVNELIRQFSAQLNIDTVINDDDDQLTPLVTQLTLCDTYK